MLLLLSILILADVNSPDDTLHFISGKQFAIAGITLGSKTEKVLAVLGKPRSIKKEVGDAYEDTAYTYFYPGLKIYIAGGSVSQSVECTSWRYATPDGIRVGDSVNKLYSIYGYSAVGQIQNNKGDIYYYCGPGSQTWMVFTVTKNKIIEISLCSPP